MLKHGALGESSTLKLQTEDSGKETVPPTRKLDGPNHDGTNFFV